VAGTTPCRSLWQLSSSGRSKSVSCGAGTSGLREPVEIRLGDRTRPHPPRRRARRPLPRSARSAFPLLALAGTAHVATQAAGDQVARVEPRPAVGLTHGLSSRDLLPVRPDPVPGFANAVCRADVVDVVQLDGSVVVLLRYASESVRCAELLLEGLRGCLCAQLRIVEDVRNSKRNYRNEESQDPCVKKASPQILQRRQV
jgi:hypothetical protein